MTSDLSVFDSPYLIMRYNNLPWPNQRTNCISDNTNAFCDYVIFSSTDCVEFYPQFATNDISAGWNATPVYDWNYETFNDSVPFATNCNVADVNVNTFAGTRENFPIEDWMIHQNYPQVASAFFGGVIVCALLGYFFHRCLRLFFSRRSR